MRNWWHTVAPGSGSAMARLRQERQQAVIDAARAVEEEYSLLGEDGDPEFVWMLVKAVRALDGGDQ